MIRDMKRCRRNWWQRLFDRVRGITPITNPDHMVRLPSDLVIWTDEQRTTHERRDFSRRHHTGE